MRTRRTVTCLALATVFTGAATAAAIAAPNQDPQSSYQVNGRVEAIVYVGDKVVLAGEFTGVAPRGSSSFDTSHRYLAAFSASTGALVDSFDPQVGGPVEALATDGSNVYAGGAFSAVHGNTALKNIVKINGSGGVNATFRPGAPGSKVSAVDYSGGRVYIGGSFTRVGGTSVFRVARLNSSSGALDTGWLPRVTNTTGTPNVRALHVAGDAVYIGGYFQQVGGQPRRSAARVSASTGAVSGWNPRIVVKQTKNRGIVYALQTATVAGSSVVFVCGDFAYANGSVTSDSGGTASPNIAAVNTTGGDMVRTVFWETTDGSVNDCLVAGRYLYVTGHFDRAGGRMAHLPPYGGSPYTGVDRHKVAAFDLTARDAQGRRIVAWDPRLTSIHGGYGLAARSDRLAVGGDFSAVNGVTQRNFAQFAGSIG
jgi:hypothetical protein